MDPQQTTERKNMTDSTLTFTNEEMGFSLSAIKIEDEPHFDGNKVCEILDIANPRDALTRLNPSDVGTTDTTETYKYGSSTRTRRKKIKTVNESGLYDLVLTSRKPEAKKFRRWITKEVLPEIRRDGSYVSKNINVEQTVRLIEKTDYKAVTDALAFAMDYREAGVLSKAAFGNMQDGFYKVVLGTTADGYREKNNLPEKAVVKDHVTFEELNKLQGLSMMLLGELRYRHPDGIYHVEDFARVYHDTVKSAWGR